MEQSPT